MNCRYVIVSDYDNPSAPLVAQYVDGIGYCYMGREIKPELRRFDGMTPSRPTNITDFGFAFREIDGIAYFEKLAPSCATYRDGKPRRWQGEESFRWPLVVGVKQKGKLSR